MLEEDLLRKLEQLEAANAVMREALEEIMARCELRRSEDDAHYENYYEAKKALSTPPSQYIQRLENAAHELLTETGKRSLNSHDQYVAYHNLKSVLEGRNE